jgi:hypothetical protein
MGGTYSTQGGNDKGIQKFSRKTGTAEATWVTMATVGGT